ncbi:hypothetical protein REPUB_Repub04eG0199500 [Reevesia pubescens]
MRGKSIFRPFLLRQAFKFRSISYSSRFSLNQNDLISTPTTISSIPKIPSPVSTFQNLALSRPFSDYPTGYQPSSLSHPSPTDYHFVSSLSEPEPPVPENIVPIKSEEEFNAAVSKAEAESVPAVFYFTATWCAPCRFLGPVMDEMARRNPQVTTYKMDIDEESLASKLRELNITAVPTVHFFKEGKKKDEVVGGDVTRIVRTMNSLYEGLKKDDSAEKINEKDDSPEQINEKDDSPEEKTKIDA